jgi:hypothetical protein
MPQPGLIPAQLDAKRIPRRTSDIRDSPLLAYLFPVGEQATTKLFDVGLHNSIEPVEVNHHELLELRGGKQFAQPRWVL